MEKKRILNFVLVLCFFIAGIGQLHTRTFYSPDSNSSDDYISAVFKDHGINLELLSLQGNHDHKANFTTTDNSNDNDNEEECHSSSVAAKKLAGLNKYFTTFFTAGTPQLHASAIKKFSTHFTQNSSTLGRRYIAFRVLRL